MLYVQTHVNLCRFRHSYVMLCTTCACIDRVIPTSTLFGINNTNASDTITFLLLDPITS
jgi:hypothetical protein